MITEHVLNTSMIRDIFDMEKMNREKNFLLDWITFVNNSSSVYEKISFGTPYRTDAPQVLLAEEGDAKVKFFHKPFLVKKGDLILKPAGTLFPYSPSARTGKCAWLNSECLKPCGKSTCSSIWISLNCQTGTFNGSKAIST